MTEDPAQVIDHEQTREKIGLIGWHPYRPQDIGGETPERVGGNGLIVFRWFVHGMYFPVGQTKRESPRRKPRR